MAVGVAETLLVEISARTIELEAKLSSANARLDAFEANAVKAGASGDKSMAGFAAGLTPVVGGLAAVGAAALAAATEAVHLGAATDGALRQIMAASPGAAQSMEGLGNTI